MLACFWIHDLICFFQIRVWRCCILRGWNMALTFAPSFENSKLSFKFILILLVLLACSFACWFCFHLILLGFDCLFVYLPSFLFCLLASLILFWHFACFLFFLFCSFYFCLLIMSLICFTNLVLFRLAFTLLVIHLFCWLIIQVLVRSRSIVFIRLIHVSKMYVSW